MLLTTHEQSRCQPAYLLAVQLVASWLVVGMVAAGSSS